MGLLENNDFPSETTREIVQKIVDEKEFTNVFFTICQGSAKGDNYVASIYRVRVEGERKGRREVLNLILKLVSPGVESRQSFPVTKFFAREIYAYSKLFNKYREIQDSVSLKEENKFKHAKFYGCNAELYKETLVFQDLKADGFIMYDRLKSIDLEHATIALRSLARLHALSFIMEEREPEICADIFSEIKDAPFITNPTKPGIRNFYQATMERAVRSIHDPTHRQKMERFLKNTYEQFVEHTLAVNKHSVICHGDFWINNLLFKYQDGIPVDVCMIDFQLTRVDSPATDLLYFIFGHSDRNFRREHYKEILDVYYEELKDYLRAFSLDITRIFPKDDLLKELERKSDYTTILLAAVMMFFTNESEDIADLNELFSCENLDIDKFITGKTVKRYEKRIQDLVADFVDYGYI